MDDLRATPFEDVERIAVVRGGGIGDLVFALPAIEALAACYPDAEIVLLGTPAHRAIVEGGRTAVSRVEVLPQVSGVRGAGEMTSDEASGFVARMQAERFDLACQLHGGGRHANPFTLALGARHTVGTRTDDAVPLERSLPYLYYQHEVLRWLEVAGLAGARPADLEPRLRLTPADLAQAARLREHWPAGLVVLHPGATDPRRRWPADRFADVARRCAADGLRVVVLGDDDEAGLADEVVARARSPRVGSVAGAVPLERLPGLLAAADVVVGNDSGPRHLAQAAGTPTVGLFWAGNMINGGPLTRRCHRVEIGWTTRCPVCGADVTQVGWTAPRCPHDPSFLTDITVDAVMDDIRSLLGVTATTAPPRGT